MVSDIILNQAKDFSIKYLEAKPFNHIVLDNFLDEGLANNVEGYIKTIPDDQWWKYDNDFEKKWAFDKIVESQFFQYLNSPVFLKFLEEMANINGLIPDPYFRGGGFHRINTYGHLDLHSDFDRHPKLDLKRRLNVLIYLNRNWKKEYNGELELYDKHTHTLAKSIEPIFNRMVCFDTTDGAIHGHPKKWLSEHPRLSVAMYYYTAYPQCDECYVDPHSTQYYPQPGNIDSEEKKEARIKRAQFRPADFYETKK